jgi:glycosyltransferase involved in cell wall biosynthesis
MRCEPELSVVVPVYNEEESVGPLYRRISQVCRDLGRTYEIVFVDDGSGDRTFELLARLHEEDPAVKVVRFRRNYGQTAAMAAGFRHARGRVICSMDGDLQNDPIDIPRLLSKVEEGYDVVCGWRKDRQDKLWSRRVPSVIANWIIGRITGVRIHDNGCSLKAYRASVIKKVSLYSEMHRFIPAMTTLTGARIAEIVVTHHARQFGVSKYGLGRVWRVVLDIFVVKMITGFAARPRMWFGLLSLPVLAAGAAALAFGISTFLGRAVEQWLVVMTVAMLCLFLGAHLISLAVIAELAVRAGGQSPVHAVPRERSATETRA